MHVDGLTVMQTDGLTEQETLYWLAFDQISSKGLGIKRIRAIYDFFGSMQEAWNAQRMDFKQSGLMSGEVLESFLSKRSEIQPEILWQKCQTAGVLVYPISHPQYPRQLKEIHDPPLVLYCKGKLPASWQWTVGMVGTRRPTAYGQRLAKDWSRNLAARGVTIVSGMAIGIDSLAHRGAIDGGGKTYAVLACGPDNCYPSSNRPLYQMLASGEYGAVISEYFPGTTPETWRFPARNRIISGLSQAVAVIEAGHTSGSLITATMAFDQSREVFAVPGRIDNPMSEGTNSLLGKTAHLMTSPDDLMKAMDWAAGASPKGEPVLVELYGKEKELYEMLSDEPVHFDVLCERSGMAAGELSATLTMLELGGVVTRHPGDWYTRI
jgi:DNA processing protein